MQFKQNPLSHRKTMSARLSSTYPDRIPVIVTPKSFRITKFKFLVPLDYTVGQFLNEFRKQIQGLPPTQGIFLLLSNNTIPRVSDQICTIFESHKDEDGFLYFTCCPETVFGG